MLDEPVPFARDIAAAVGGAGDGIGDDVEQHAQAGGQHGAGQHQPLRRDVRAEVPADHRQLGVDGLAVASARSEQDRLGEKFGPGGVFACLSAERDAEPKLHHR